jgi:hypothetical protein
VKASVLHREVVGDFEKFVPADPFCCPSHKGRARLMAEGQQPVVAR